MGKERESVVPGEDPWEQGRFLCLEDRGSQGWPGPNTGVRVGGREGIPRS